MIPYQDLVAALRHWRERNGLPNFGTEPVGPPPSMAFSPPPGPPPAPLSFAARTAPPGPPPGAARGDGVMELGDEIEAHEIESEEIYENEGGDFAMSFSGPAGTPPPQPPGFATEPGVNSKFPGGGGYTEPGRTDPEPDKFGASTFDDDFVAETSPAPQLVRDLGTKPGVAVGKDVDTADETLVADDDVKPSGKKKTKKKR